MKLSLPAWLVIGLGLPVALSSTACAADLVQDEGGYWRRYYQFGPSRFSPAVLKSEGLKVLGAQEMNKLKQKTEKWLTQQGLDPAKVDWRDHAVLDATSGYRSFCPTPTPLPPEAWTAADFDDGSWVRQRGPFQGTRLAQPTTLNLGQYDEAVDLRLQAAYYRGRFLVDDPAKAGSLTLRLVYCGGARVLVNGKELARGHLPPGNLPADASGETYPAQAYGQGGEGLRERVLGPVEIRPEMLRAGVNVLAVEIRASWVHPLVQKNPIQPNWGGPGRPFPHARLCKLELRPASAAVPSAVVRPAGVQVWVEDVNRRVESDEFLPPGEAPGVIRLVAPRNGTCSAQIVVGTSKALTGLQAKPGELSRAGGTERLPAAAFQVLYMVPYPAAEWTMKRLGDERGLGAGFPDNQQLSRYAGFGAGGPQLFDRLAAAAPAEVPAGASCPLWLSLRVPPDAAAGQYRGKLEVSAQGTVPVSLPVELEVFDWVLPDPRDFRTFVGCEENPYAVAKQYGTPLWSDEHFKLLEASFRQLGRVGNTWLNVPVILRTEYGNKGDSPVRWTRKRDGSLDFDFAILDRYLDLAVKHCGKPKVVHFIVMQGMGRQTGPGMAQVNVRDEATGGTATLSLGDGKALGPAEKNAWGALAKALVAHMKARGLDRSMYWGAPLEGEADPELKNVLIAAAPGVGWTAGPHEMMYNGKYAKDEKFYKLVADIRYQGGWPSFRDDQGWKSKTIHLLNPRVGGTAFALHTTSAPFAYRMLPERALSRGRNGFTRLGADEWAGCHYEGMPPAPPWITGIPVLFMLWPGKDGAEGSARFEALLEGIQETEARIFLEQALDRGGLSADLAGRVRKVLASRVVESSFFLGNSIVYSLEENHSGWQERSRELYQAAAEVAKAGQGAVP
jgi:hypothetical protein